MKISDVFYILASRSNTDEFWEWKKIRIYACRGVGTEGESNKCYEEDLIKAITGCIKKDYERSNEGNFMI